MVGYVVLFVWTLFVVFLCGMLWVDMGFFVLYCLFCVCVINSDLLPFWTRFILFP